MAGRRRRLLPPAVDARARSNGDRSARPDVTMPLIVLTACRKLEDYRQAVLHVGGEVRVVDQTVTLEEALAGVSGLLLTGGDDVAPARYGESKHPAVVEVEPE